MGEARRRKQRATDRDRRIRAAEAARQARLQAQWEASPVGREEMVFWDASAAEAWDDEHD